MTLCFSGYLLCPPPFFFLHFHFCHNLISSDFSISYLFILLPFISFPSNDLFHLCLSPISFFISSSSAYIFHSCYVKQFLFIALRKFLHPLLSFNHNFSYLNHLSDQHSCLPTIFSHPIFYILPILHRRSLFSFKPITLFNLHFLGISFNYYSLVQIRYHPHPQPGFPRPWLLYHPDHGPGNSTHFPQVTASLLQACSTPLSLYSLVSQLINIQGKLFLPLCFPFLTVVKTPLLTPSIPHLTMTLWPFSSFSFSSLTTFLTSSSLSFHFYTFSSFSSCFSKSSSPFLLASSPYPHSPPPFPFVSLNLPLLLFLLLNLTHILLLTHHHLLPLLLLLDASRPKRWWWSIGGHKVIFGSPLVAAAVFIAG